MTPVNGSSLGSSPKSTLGQLVANHCVSVYADITLQGFEGGSKRVTANLYDASSRAPVPGYSYFPPAPPLRKGTELEAVIRILRAAQGFDFRSRADSDQYVARMCLARLFDRPPSGRYFVRVELEDDNGRLLAFKDSGPVRFTRR